MKKSVFSVLFLLVFMSILICSQGCGKSDEFDFRKTRWGMSKEEVKNTEVQKPLYDQHGILVYKTELLGKPFELVYTYKNNELIAAGYELQGDVSKHDYVSVYKALVELVQKRYGPPIKEEELWKDSVNISSNSKEMNSAIAAGKLRKVAEWKTNTSKIVVNCIGMQE